MKTLALKISRINSKIVAQDKQSQNKHGGYMYFSEAQLAEYLRPLIANEGLSIFHSTDKVSFHEVNGANRPRHLCLVETSHTIIDSESGESITVKSAGSEFDDKNIYKAITGANKYFYMKLFMISDFMDPENEDNVDNVRSVTPQTFGGGMMKQVAVESKKQDDFYRQALLTAIKAEGIPSEFVLEGCHKTNWIDKNVDSIGDFPEGKAQALLGRLPKLKETWLKSQEAK